jgi:hypothetical protein
LYGSGWSARPVCTGRTCAPWTSAASRLSACSSWGRRGASVSTPPLPSYKSDAHPSPLVQIGHAPLPSRTNRTRAPLDAACPLSTRGGGRILQALPLAVELLAGAGEVEVQLRTGHGTQHSKVDATFECWKGCGSLCRRCISASVTRNAGLGATNTPPHADRTRAPPLSYKSDARPSPPYKSDARPSPLVQNGRASLPYSPGVGRS